MNKLGITVTDSVTGITGKLTHLSITGTMRPIVFLRPNTLHPDSKEPAEGFWIDTARIPGLDAATIVSKMPTLALNTKATDPSNGYSGTIIELCLHQNGCVHVILQPPGFDPKTGTRYKPQNVDIRDLEGEAIPKLNDAETDESRVTRPSPSPFTAYQPGR